MAINAGGKAAAGFGADAYFSGGDTYATSAGIDGTSADAIYQSERYGDFKYAVGLENGTYDVTLKFAEIYLDKRRPAAVRRRGREPAHPRQLRHLRRRRQERRGRPELRGHGHRRPARPRVPQRQGQRQGERHRDRAGGRRRGGPDADARARRRAAAPSSRSTPAARRRTASRADAFYFGGDTYATTAGIGGTSDDAIYQTERYGDFKYSAAVKNGTYDVTLKFAEIYLDKAGQRLFDVEAENKLVLDDYDVFREAGGKNIAHDESFEVKVTDGRLDLEFLSVKDNAKVSGIEIDYLA